MESSDSSWKASLEDPTIGLVQCVETGCTKFIIARSSAEFRCGKHENEYQAYLDSIPGEIWYE